MTTKTTATGKRGPRTRPVLALSLGCPSGVGPEVSVLGARAAGRAVAPLFVGDPEVVERAVQTAKLRGRVELVASREAALAARPGVFAVWSSSARVGTAPAPGAPDAAAGRAQLAWIDQATDLVRGGVADALVTGPVSKHAIATSGARGAAKFLGHTEHLARRLRSREVVMAFWAEELTTALVTTHLRLADVPGAVKPRAVATSTYWLARLLEALGASPPRIAVAALNPHAGEGGLLGDEESKSLAPGIHAAKARLEKEGRRVVLDGPLGAETAFRRAIRREGHAAPSYDGVVAMYHDQATIPMKVLAFGDAVNVTLGLPIIRTSVDHGTGYDIAWKGIADASGMIRAIVLARRLVVSR